MIKLTNASQPTKPAPHSTINTQNQHFDPAQPPQHLQQIYMAYARPPAVCFSMKSMRLSARLDIVELKVDPEGKDTGPHKQDEEGDDEVPKGTK